MRFVWVMTTDTILVLHGGMNDLLFIESFLVFMTTQAEIRTGLHQVRMGLGIGHIMAVVTRSLCNRCVDIRGLASVGMALR
jgi:hypothetical protein